MAQPSSEAHEVQSVRKKVEGMGVENDQLEPQTDTITDMNTETTQDAEEPKSIPAHSESLKPEQTTAGLADNPKITPDSVPSGDSSSKELPRSWDAYADLHSPFACFAPGPNSSVVAQPAVNPSTSTGSSADPPLARAFAPSTGFGNLATSNSLCPNKFPSGSDFFLKGKRNTPLADSSPDADTESATQNKKLKLPPSSSSTPVPPSSTSSASNNTQQGFANYAIGSSTSLKSRALEKLNSTPSLQTSSLQPTSAVSSFLKTNQPSSVASSTCAVNGEADESVTPALSTPSALSATTPASAQIPASLGFSAFANKSGFQDSSKPTVDWSDHPTTSSVFDQTPQQPEKSPDQNGSNTENTEWGGAQSHQKKTHLALSAELSQEDKHEGFSATEVITGEENEDLIKSVRCKMFTLGEDGSWRERGTGGLRLLRTKEKPFRFRLIMRADAVLRVLLNVPIFKGFSYRPTQEKFLTFASTHVVTSNNNHHDEENKANGSNSESPEKEQVDPSDNNQQKPHFQQYLCRFGKPEARQEMIEGIEECLNQLKRYQSSETKGETNYDEEGSFVDACDLV